MPGGKFILFSDLYERGGLERAFAAIYVILTVKTNADEDTDFAQRTVELRKLPEELWMQALLKAGYDGFFLLGDELDVPLGHTFWHEHDGWLGVFQIYTTPLHRERGVGTAVIRQILEMALERPELSYIQIGNGGSEELSDRLRKIRTEPIAGVRYHPDDIGRFEFPRSA